MDQKQGYIRLRPILSIVLKEGHKIDNPCILY